jgi:DNA ligase-1
MIPLMHGTDADLDDLGQYVGWFCQEKYRGVRLYWDGKHAWSRQGHEILLPDDWYESMPIIALDCELYDGINGERRCASATRFGLKHITPSMKIIAFDSPEKPHCPWDDRIFQVYVALQDADFDRIEYAPYSQIKSVDHMLAALAEVKDRGGEGLMLRRPGLPYQAGYSFDLVKLKHAV